MNDGGVDAALVHHRDRLRGGKRCHLPVREIARQARAPEVDLRVDDLHRKPLHFCAPGKRSLRHASGNTRVCQQSRPGIMRPLSGPAPTATAASPMPHRAYRWVSALDDAGLPHRSRCANMTVCGSSSPSTPQRSLPGCSRRRPKTFAKRSTGWPSIRSRRTTICVHSRAWRTGFAFGSATGGSRKRSIATPVS